MSIINTVKGFYGLHNNCQINIKILVNFVISYYNKIHRIEQIFKYLHKYSST